jgi:ribonuclease D
MKVVIIDTTDKISVLSQIPQFKLLYFDVEGVNLSKHGSIVFIQLCIHNVVYIIDVQSIGLPPVLKKFFEDTHIVKLSYDIRNDVASLYYQYNIDMKNVRCLQITYMAYLWEFKRHLYTSKLLSLKSVLEYENIADSNNKSLITDYRDMTIRPIPNHVYTYIVTDTHVLPSIDKLEVLSESVKSKVYFYSQSRLNNVKLDS